jgi:hypothetical protein
MALASSIKVTALASGPRENLLVLVNKSSRSHPNKAIPRPIDLSDGDNGVKKAAVTSPIGAILVTTGRIRLHMVSVELCMLVS